MLSPDGETAPFAENVIIDGAVELWLVYIYTYIFYYICFILQKYMLILCIYIYVFSIIYILYLYTAVVHIISCY